MVAMNTLLLVIFVALFLGGCQLSLPRTVVIANPAELMANAMPAPQAPVGSLDCDTDGLVSREELGRGFTVNGRAVTLAEFEAADGDRDARWNEQEFQTYLRGGHIRGWSVNDPCGADD
jgi:hypothetical protein